MSMDFSGSAGAASSFDLLPKGALLFANLTVKGLKGSASGGGYLDCELTIDEGQPFAGRKIFDMIGDPTNMGNSEKYREMGTIAITRILECRGAGPNNPAGYKIDNFTQLSGARVGIKVGIEPGTDGHNDKNRVAEWLTPNPASQSGHKGWVKLMSGDHGITSQPSSQAQTGGFGGFGGSTQPQAQPSSGFGGQAGGAAQQANSGFQEPAGNASTTTTSHSDPAGTPGWLAQANG